MKRKKIKVIENYVHRYFRLTPVLAMVVLMITTLSTNIGEGPLWGDLSSIPDDCIDHWWAFLLYIPNYYPQEQCLLPAWYLGVDMQCYIVAVVIMVFLKRWSKLTLTGMGLLVSLSAAASFWSCYIHALPTVRIDYTDKTEDYNRYYYKLTHTRCGPYIIGMICGYIIYNIKSSPRTYKLPIVLKILYWIICLALLATCIFVPLSLNEDTVWQNALFISLHRLVWSICVCSIIIMCVTNNAGCE
ncbi:nose resistant to fluoxetine protein 6 isoform X2 [Leptinotarsa decemlineata]|uniref:nose resistant to fluoxetine protein 6 isoform X2 n=1 Tax=Leptinotarsa decemlineata TaxID=7539 RepID=UPI003D30AC7E